ncbi:MAG TPA: hypothetical protein VE010_17540, partial [Thermoanaerobaculia bacterium]|nr:hypothetical protein [Thermoanaerobaculia bacterium]
MPRPFLAAAVLAAICALPLSARTHVWTGSESNLFSDPANWIGGSPADDPEAELVFPRAVRQSVINDLHGVTVKSITIEEDGYRIAGKPLALVEGAELDVRDADIVCALLFDGQAVAQPRRGQFRYSAAAVPAIHPALSLDAAASSVITIEHYGARARVTPGAETAWHWDVFRAGFPAVHEIHNTLLGDTDNDGEVRWNLQSDKIRVKGIVAVIDQRAGSVHAVTGDGAAIAPSAEKINFLRDVSGHFAWANVPSGSRFLKTLWVRPGVGAWRGGPSTITTRYPGSDHALVKLADGIPVEGSPAPPAGVEPGDFFIATAVAETSATLFGGPVDERLAAAPSLPSEFWIPNYFHGREGGVATVTVYRLGSTERAATVHYRTGPADPGPVLYRPIEGTLAFAPHEFSRDVTIPLLADGVYGGTVH